MSSDVETGGGANIGRDVSTGGGNFAGRDDRPLIINTGTTEWREGVYVRLESHDQRITNHDQRISNLEMTDYVRRQHEQMTTYQKFVIAWGVALVIAFFALAYEMRQLTAQLADSNRTEQMQKYRP